MSKLKIIVMNNPMFKFLQGLTITVTFVATFVLALLYASNDLIADTQDTQPETIPIEISLCNDIEEVLLEAMEEGEIEEYEVIDIVQTCRDKNE
jgi:hypothetical protein